jgi:hypothetical protein
MSCISLHLLGRQSENTSGHDRLEVSLPCIKIFASGTGSLRRNVIPSSAPKFSALHVFDETASQKSPSFLSTHRSSSGSAPFLTAGFPLIPNTSACFAVYPVASEGEPPEEPRGRDPLLPHDHHTSPGKTGANYWEAKKSRPVRSRDPKL